MITIQELSTGYLRAQGDGTCEWAQWPRDRLPGPDDFFPEASDSFRRQLADHLQLFGSGAATEPKPFMSPAEVAFLERNLTPRDRMWEWGSGGSTLWLAKRVRRLTTVEHQREFAARVVAEAPPNVQVIYAPPERPWTDEHGRDGDLDEFRRYVECYTGRDVDVVLIDGRARPWCARQVAECSAFGPFPGMRIFAHDADREEVRRMWVDDIDRWGRGYFREVERVENLIMMEPRL